MDPYTETGSVNVEFDSSSWPHSSKTLPELLTEICYKAQRMLKLIKDGQPEPTESFLTLYQSLGETYNLLNQELLNGLLKVGFKPSSSSDHNIASAPDFSSFRSDSSHSLEFDLVSGVSYSSLKHHHELSPRRRYPGKEPSLKPNDEAEKKDQSAYSLADIFSDELRTALKDLEERNRLVGELESKLSDSSDKIKTLERELDECHELLEVSEVEVSKLNEMLSERKTEKADDGVADDLMLDSLRAELRSRDVQIEQMEEYLNQVCVKDTELVSDESRTDKNVVEELKSRVEELENQVEKQRDVISEREEEKREAIRELCFSLDHYKSRYIELVVSLSGNN
ncbi:Tropomyosin [Hirschfeldia incana]|nr:Tropomyosin [Hirschfeldia incana]